MDVMKEAACERDQSLTITVEQAAQLLGISRGSAYSLARCGELPGAIRLGGRIVVSRSKLETAINGPTDARAA